MRQERVTATRNVTRQLKVAEIAVDQAGIELAELCATMLKARRESGLSAIVGADVFSSVVATFTNWANVRDQIVSNHQMLDRVAAQIGTQITAGGGGDDKPPMENFAPKGTDDNVVPIAA